MAHRKFLWGMLITITFALVLTGCPKEEEEDKKDDPPEPTVGGVQLYTSAGEKYNGTGSEQKVTGKISGPADTTPSELEDIGTISADGKLTLSLPATVADDKLFSTNGVDAKFGTLTLDKISLKNLLMDHDSAMIMYVNKDVSVSGLNLKQGWNYVKSSTPQAIIPADQIETDSTPKKYQWIKNN